MVKRVVKAAIYRAPKTPQALLGLGCFCLALLITTIVTVNSRNAHVPMVVPRVVDLPKPVVKATPLEATDMSGIAVQMAKPEPASLEDQALNVLTKTVKVKRGDILANLLEKNGIASDAAYKIIQAFDKKYSVRRLKPGHEISLTYRPAENEQVDLEELVFRPSVDKIVSVKQVSEGNYEASESAVELKKELRRVSGQINGSVFASMLERGVPPAIVNTLIHAFSYDIDFQRDVRAHDSFEVVVERYFDPETGAERAGDALYANLNIDGQPYKMYFFHPQNGEPGFFNESGQSVQKALLKTPVDGARISGVFGKRKHPVLGYTKMHRGVDFAAPTGTPIMSAGDGTIERIGRYGSYGNYVRVRHGNGYSTAYAHLKGYGKGLKVNSRVKQGQVIGYIGTTGRSTGPHLHYEVLKNGKQINPKTMSNASVGKKLAGADLKNFEKAKLQIEQKVASLDTSDAILPKVASLFIGTSVSNRV